MSGARQPDAQPDRRPDTVLDALREPAEAPDQTGRIMGRLGYMHAVPAAVRRRRWRLLAGRCFAAAVTVGAIAAALYLHRVGPDARGRAPSLQDAIGRDIDRHQQRIDRTIRWLRELTPSAPVQPGAPAEGPIDADIDRSAVGPVRWL
jgi:hypothetical protein